MVTMVWVVGRNLV